MARTGIRIKGPRAASEELHEAIIVGGSYAGLSAGLQLARARRRILIVDAGLRRNRFVSQAHGFLAQDGRSPDEILHDARKQLLEYGTVTFLRATATEAAGSMNDFRITTDRGDSHRGMRLLLATGLKDELPAIPGLDERWGTTVFQCPYCHGYELNRGRIAVIATGASAYHHAAMVADWGEVALFTNGAVDLDDEQERHLKDRGVVIERERVLRVSGATTIELRDGRSEPFAGIFTAARTSLASDLASLVGCELEDGHFGQHIKADRFGQTSVSGVFACGDGTGMAGSIAVAVSSGATAAVGLHRSLVFA